MGLYREVIFPRFFDFVVSHKVFDEKREKTLARAKGKILEIGAGTGLNLERYPKTIKEITVVEPNPGIKKEFLKKVIKHRIKADFHLVGAEKMPFQDEEFDTVISTITLCSIPKLQDALREVLRVLKPDGQFLFLDHGLSTEYSVAKLQKFLNPLQSLIGAGCSLTVNVEKELTQAGFQIREIQKYHIDNAPKFIGFVYEGTASKKFDH